VAKDVVGAAVVVFAAVVTKYVVGAPVVAKDVVGAAVVVFAAVVARVVAAAVVVFAAVVARVVAAAVVAIDVVGAAVVAATKFLKIFGNELILANTFASGVGAAVVG